jgi:BirA family biotin operon repressor/biotin-[acetyl-CoA-carboxylase] ligase
VASGVRQQVIDNCVSLGRQVRAELPDGSNLVGRAATIDDSGRLVLDVSGEVVPLSAADIVHLRH